MTPKLPMLDFKTIRGTRVLLRVDVNVPVDEHGFVSPSIRLRRAVGTMKQLHEAGARTVVLAHRGEPKGVDPSLSLAPIARVLGEMLPAGALFFVPWAPIVDIVAKTNMMAPGDILILENVRFDPRETKNDEGFAKELSALGDLYVNDAFGVCHREHASVVGVAKQLPSCAGLSLMLELEALEEVRDVKKRPFVAVVGGAKMQTKIHALAALLERADTVFVGGALAEVFFAANRTSKASATMSLDAVRVAEKLLHKKSLMLPSDVIVRAGDGRYRKCAPDDLVEDERIVDLGPETLKAMEAAVRKASLVVWNGPIGVIEEPQSRVGTDALVHILASVGKTPATVIIGGGETADIPEELGLADFFDHVSVGGGAMLEYISGGALPGIEVLKK